MKKTTVFITHDLDEAVRVGHRIAIMRDGKVIQIGTPEEIVMKPADNYVADFVKGISRLKIVQAKSIMQPIDKFEKEFGQYHFTRCLKGQLLLENRAFLFRLFVHVLG